MDWDIEIGEPGLLVDCRGVPPVLSLLDRLYALLDEPQNRPSGVHDQASSAESMTR